MVKLNDTYLRIRAAKAARIRDSNAWYLSGNIFVFRNHAETDGQRTTKAPTGRTRLDGRTIYIVPNVFIPHWDQYSNVKLNRP